MLELQLDDHAHLALLGPQHAEAYYALIEAHRAHIATFVRTPPRLQSVAETRTKLQEHARAYDAGTSIPLGIWHDGTLVGEVGARLDLREHGASLGYFLAQDVQGRGLVTRACTALITYMFTHRDVYRVELQASVTNTRSCAVARRLGFQLEGIRRGGQFLNGEHVDMALYGLCRPDWPVAK